MGAAALSIFVGLSGGIAVGAGFVAFLMVLDLIPRLVQLSRSVRFLAHYEMAVILGAFFWTITDFFEWGFPLFRLGAMFVGLLDGIFVGMLAAALTEVLNVIPILARRMGLNQYVVWLLLAMAAGKVIGSLFEWIIFQRMGQL